MIVSQSWLYKFNEETRNLAPRTTRRLGLRYPPLVMTLLFQRQNSTLLKPDSLTNSSVEQSLSEVNDCGSESPSSNGDWIQAFDILSRNVENNFETRRNLNVIWSPVRVDVLSLMKEINAVDYDNKYPGWCTGVYDLKEMVPRTVLKIFQFNSKNFLATLPSWLNTNGSRIEDEECTSFIRPTMMAHVIFRFKLAFGDKAAVLLVLPFRGLEHYVA
ncbi:hypothetical protein CUMW_275540 [Citrus unshiu]|uniref:Uncharacterized protein n=1 Tax=Citrus unshiu TaxID=55188 RepID=A0A2H5N1W1_CITUN|nr:hypothetical protein CUMW_275540 [Citrus unshiu]